MIVVCFYILFDELMLILMHRLIIYLYFCAILLLAIQFFDYF